MESTSERRAGLRRILSAAVVAGAFATIPLIVLLEQEPTPDWVRAADWIVWAVFLIEYTALLMIAPHRWAYLKRNVLSLVVVVLSFPLLPAALGIVRLVRLVRFLRLLRLFGVAVRAMSGLRAVLGRRSVLCMAGATVILVCAGGCALALLEPQTVRHGIADGVW